MNPHCGPKKAKAAIDRVFDRCFADTAPFDRCASLSAHIQLDCTSQLRTEEQWVPNPDMTCSLLQLNGWRSLHAGYLEERVVHVLPVIGRCVRVLVAHCQALYRVIFDVSVEQQHTT